MKNLLLSTLFWFLWWSLNFAIILNSFHSQNPPYLKAKNIGHHRHPYLRVNLKENHLSKYIWWKSYCSRLYSGSDGGLSSLLSDGDVATFLASCCDMHVSLSRALYKLEFSRCRHRWVSSTPLGFSLHLPEFNSRLTALVESTCWNPAELFISPTFGCQTKDYVPKPAL